MPKGKKGPIPQAKDEITEQQTDPTAEQIVGEENVVDVGSATEITETSPFVQEIIPGYTCADCSFRSSFLSEIEEHCNGTGHGGFKEDEPESVQAELFSTPGTVHRMINIPMDPEFLNDKRKRLSELYQSALEVKEEKKSADDDCNARLKNIDNQMQEIARVLKTPWTYERVDCEWKILNEESARGLYRRDTGELIEKQPLTAEDHAAQLEQVSTANAEPASTEEVPA